MTGRDEALKLLYQDKWNTFSVERLGIDQSRINHQSLVMKPAEARKVVDDTVLHVANFLERSVRFQSMVIDTAALALLGQSVAAPLTTWQQQSGNALLAFVRLYQTLQDLFVAPAGRWRAWTSSGARLSSRSSCAAAWRRAGSPRPKSPLRL